jgi:hypothetical protein
MRRSIRLMVLSPELRADHFDRTRADTGELQQLVIAHLLQSAQPLHAIIAEHLDKPSRQAASDDKVTASRSAPVRHLAPSSLASVKPEKRQLVP